jgi:serine phosphatase RsbU (regulator of sigma subunit)
VPEIDLELAPGDTMLLMTDGVVEYPGAHDMFGFERVHAELAAHADLGPAHVIEAITDKLTAHGSVQDDDVTLLVLKYLGAAGPAAVS